LGWITDHAAWRMRVDDLLDSRPATRSDAVTGSA
jgi:hypothetical protein